MVQHRDDLGLTDDQVRELEVLDQERQKEDAAVRDEIERKAKQAHDAKAAAGGGGPPAGRGQGMGGGGMRGGGMRGGGMGGRGPRGGGAGAAPGRDAPAEASLEDRLDANDTKAYLDGEAVLNDEQREKAREIASDFREKLYDRRALLRARAAAGAK